MGGGVWPSLSSAGHAAIRWRGGPGAEFFWRAIEKRVLEPPPLVAMAPKAKPTSVAMSECVALDHLGKVASSRVAATWTPPGSVVPLRTILYDIRRCVKDGSLMSVWREETEKHRGRRYSGLGEVPALRDIPDHLRSLLEAGVNHSTVGMSLFALPGYVRHILRSGIKDLYILDLVNAHPSFMAMRNPTLKSLLAYCEDRERHLADVMAACRVDRKAAKELFIRILYGGAVGTWCRDHGVAVKTAPRFVQTYKADMDKAVAADYNRHKSFYPAGTPRSKVIYYLNTQAERECIDKVEELLLDAGADIQAYEHDGLSFIMPVGDMGELIRRGSEACGYMVAVEPPRPSSRPCRC